MSDLMAGFKAAAAGLDRDHEQSADWLEGFDGFAIGRAQNEALKAEHEAYMASPEYRAKGKAIKAKLRARCMYSSTPRTL